jgi:protein-tyrosine-phosphatase
MPEQTWKWCGCREQSFFVVAEACCTPAPQASVHEELTTRLEQEETMFNVIFACVHNAGRSQMAAALFNQFADPQKARAISGGTEPGLRVHPEVLTVMQEIGLDLSQAKPQRLTEEAARDAQLLITMGCGDKCPYVPGLRRDDWPLRDPKGRPLEEVRMIRDEIQDRVRALLAKESLRG